MKNKIFLLLSFTPFLLYSISPLAFTSCKDKKEATQTTEEPTTEEVTKDEAVKTEKVTAAQLIEKWQSKEIKVDKGGKEPDIVTLLKAFNSGWETQVVSDLLSEAKDPNFTRSINRDTGGGTIADRKNGYAEVRAGDTDGDDMNAAVWKRKNGHRLFMVNIVTPQNDNHGLPDKQALCIYDYDPDTQTLKPEQNAISQFTTTKDQYLVYKFPQTGTTVNIGERDNENVTKWNFFTWDGDKFTKKGTYTEDQLNKMIVGTWVKAEKDKPALTFTITYDQNEGYMLSDCGIYGSTEYEAYHTINDGFLYISSINEEEEEQPELECTFEIVNQNQLKGMYYFRQNGGKESRGNITLKRGEPENSLADYAE